MIKENKSRIPVGRLKYLDEFIVDIDLITALLDDNRTMSKTELRRFLNERKNKKVN